MKSGIQIRNILQGLLSSSPPRPAASHASMLVKSELRISESEFPGNSPATWEFPTDLGIRLSQSQEIPDS